MQRFRDPVNVQTSTVQGPAVETTVVPKRAGKVARRRKRSRMNRAQKILIGICFGSPFVAALVGCMAFAAHLQLIASQRDEDLAAIRRMGMRTSYEEYVPKPVPNATNAAPLYHQAIDQLHLPVQKEASDSVELALSSRTSLIANLEASALYPSLADTYALIERAADRPNCVWNRDWSLGNRVTFPEYGELKGMVRLLCYKAKVQTEAGDTEGALRSLARAKRISEHAGTEPFTISRLVQIACESVVLDCLEDIAQMPAFGPTELSKADSLVAGFGDLPNFRETYGGEVTFTRTALSQISHIGDFAHVYEMNPAAKSPLDDVPVPALFKQALEANYLRQIRKYFEELPQDPNDWEGMIRASERSDRRFAEDTGFVGLITGIFSPVYSSSGQALGNLQTSRYLARTTLALLRQRALHQPLQVPKGEFGLDPFSRKPFMLRKDPWGYTLWGVGADRIDNGGPYTAAGHDITDRVVIIRDPE